ncbi:heat shock factor binding protein 1-domain-containing protein [Crepidotus variabilis]|uniref:Heat shock factor binding protein 1-domain-containing protein n=1 Tax=Crepidotus variabilis TaxID=179855 RepID=A0A9P6EPS0_9AGAR|nr:heat shock factor binding protein 1-domain-containing protein [Crepidotus variabilis]
MSKPASAQPLKVPATPSKSTDNDKDKTPMPSKQSGPSKLGAIAPKDISSPHELTAFVETLLEQLDSKFDDMSSQILERMNQMSTRVDALEMSIQDIINGDISVPTSPSPAPATPGGIRRAESSG